MGEIQMAPHSFTTRRSLLRYPRAGTRRLIYDSIANFLHIFSPFLFLFSFLFSVLSFFCMCVFFLFVLYFVVEMKKSKVEGGGH